MTVVDTLLVPGTHPKDGGYTTNVFKEKQQQMVQVAQNLESKGFIPKELIKNEVSWFYGQVSDLCSCIDDYYFAMETVETISSHIMALYGAKILAFTRQEKSLNINLERETDDIGVYIHTSMPGVSQVDGPQYERRIDTNYLDVSMPSRAFRMESYRSRGTVSSSSNTQLRCYFVSLCDFVNPTPAEHQLTDIHQCADKSFLGKATAHTISAYEEVMSHVVRRTGLVIRIYDIEGGREKKLVIGYKQRSTQKFLSAMSDLYHYYDLYSSRKYVEQFSNGVTIMALYLNTLPGAKSPPIEHTIHQVMKEASLIHCLPVTPLQSFFQRSTMSVQEAIYGHVGWIFAQHFLNRLGSEYKSLDSILDRSNPVHEEVLNKMKKRLRTDTFTREYILDIIKMYPELLKLLYANFAMVHYVNQATGSLKPTLSYQRLQTQTILKDDELHEIIRKATSNSHELMVLESFLIFNKHVLKTNFYQNTKVALAFRLDPSFLPEIEYPNKVYGMFFVVGSEFRGFHIRFRDIARGGIRIIRSRNKEAYSINLRSLFDENYALAATQQRKNKDIPEGGSKGTILLDINQQEKPKVAFEKYVDCILDLLIDGETPGIKDKLVDLYKKPEILFFGPDEGTADYMDWASNHARERGATFWKAFTTGKSQSMGGIPHDLYGMTTRSVHQYALGIYRKLGLKEDQVTKFQTGGPDGDLGSNEIKISQDKTMAIVDGSGVIYDPEGLDRNELNRLATSRMMINHFDTGKLGKNGFRVLIDDINVTLPSGEIVDDGLTFRNNFHVNPLSSALIFIPCGGRPESIDLSNVSKLLDIDGNPRFKYIVEGANLFLTQEARLRLEKAGMIIFKDASANKGGVTSSSLEVLAALAFNDAEFAEHMCVKDGKVPAFYGAYVKEVQRIIEHNAEMEFECIWREHRRTNSPRSLISDDLSVAIVTLNEQLQHTSLWDNLSLRKMVLKEAFPNLLLQKLGLDVLVERVPENYVRAIFGAYLASRFVYKFGTNPSQFAFFEFMNSAYFDKMV